MNELLVSVVIPKNVKIKKFSNSNSNSKATLHKKFECKKDYE